MSIFKRLLEAVPSQASKKVLYYLQQELIEHFDVEVKFHWSDWRPDPEKKDRDEGYMTRFKLGQTTFEIWLWDERGVARSSVGLFTISGDNSNPEGSFNMDEPGVDELIYRLKRLLEVRDQTKAAHDEWVKTTS